MNLGSIFATISKDGHVPIGLFIFVVGSVLHYIHGLDASFVAFSTTVLGFLGGHAWVKAPDGGSDVPASNK